jgi:hypothetical protein
MRRRKTAGGGLRGRARATPIVAAILVLALFAAADASAAVRFAAPEGNDEPGSECLQSNPCSLFNAAGRDAPATKLKPGDEIVVEPGTYSGPAGDLGAKESIATSARVSIHGVSGQRRPVIEAQEGNGATAFVLDLPDQRLSHLEILAGASSGAWRIASASSVIDGVVAISRGEFSCFANGGLVRNSVCISTAPSIAALAILQAGLVPPIVELRNVTSIATGPDASGLAVLAFSADQEVDVHGIGVLAHGTGSAGDVFARAANSGRVVVALSHSDFATTHPETDGSVDAAATITEPGMGEANITAPARLAADNYHELPDSPTVDAGALDPIDSSLSGTTDIDGDARALGPAPDIGADELRVVNITITSLSCVPAGVVVGEPTSCAATVSSPGDSPTGAVRLGSDSTGSFAGGGICVLTPSGQGKSSCQLPYTPGVPGSHRLIASYEGDAENLPSQAAALVQVSIRSQTAPIATPAPDTTLKKQPPRRSASRTATFSFASDQPGSRFECKLDRKPFRPCPPTLRLKGLKRGRHAFSVRAVGPTGIADPTPASFRWTVS